MTQRFLSPRFVAVTSVALATAGFVIVACSSDETSPDMTMGPLVPGPGSSTAGSGGSNATETPGQPTANAGSGNVSAGGSEAQPGDVPIDPGVGGTGNSSGGSGGGGSTTPPPDVPVTITANCTPPEGPVPALALTPVAQGLDQPLYVTGVPGDDSRLFVLEKTGAVRVIVDGELQDEPFIDITNQLVSGGERGLLGLAFHPQYASNGLFYLHYSSSGGAGITAGDGVVAEFSVDPNNRSLANAASRRQILLVGQPQANHNGGQITFGLDGLLYLGFGDGGGGNDNHGAIGNGQALDTLLGKILRIDPLGRDVSDAYSIPAGNLAAVTNNQAARGEIWAYGLRNPWRFSFDPCNGDLYVGDVGQDTLEEVDFVAGNTPAGTNFGWRIMEGPNCRPTDATCNGNTQQDLVLPVDSYATQQQQQPTRASVTGGYVYRGSAIPGLRGTYIYADYVRSTFFRFRIENGAAVGKTDITAQLRAGGGPPQNIASFGQDNAGEVYVASFNPGTVYRITAAP